MDLRGTAPAGALRRRAGYRRDNGKFYGTGRSEIRIAEKGGLGRRGRWNVWSACDRSGGGRGGARFGFEGTEPGGIWETSRHDCRNGRSRANAGREAAEIE